MKGIFRNRGGKPRSPPIKANYLKRTPSPVAETREDPQRIKNLQDSARALLDQFHDLRKSNEALQDNNQALQTVVAKNDGDLPDRMQRMINDEAAKMAEEKVQQVLANNHVIPMNDPNAALAFVANFCQDNGFDLYRADGSPSPDLNEFLQGLIPPQATQGPVYGNSSAPGYGASGGPSATTPTPAATSTPATIHTWSGPRVPNTVMPAPATNPNGGLSIFGAAGGFGTSGGFGAASNPTTSAPPAATAIPATTNANGGNDFGFPQPIATGTFRTPSNGAVGGSAPTTTPAGLTGGFGAASDPQATKAPVIDIDPERLIIKFSNQDDNIAKIVRPFRRNMTLQTCQTVYRIDKEVNLGSDCECTFYYAGLELDMKIQLKDFTMFQSLNKVTIEVRTASKPPT